jgi:hypothetical protein
MLGGGQQAQPAKPTPTLDPWVEAEIQKAARARAQEPEQPGMQEPAQKTGGAMTDKPEERAARPLDEVAARLREWQKETAALRAELPQRQQQQQAEVRRLEIEQKQLELRRQARESPLREERDRQLMAELQRSAPSIAVDWVKARAAIAERPELFEEVRWCARNVGNYTAAERLPAVMARLESQRPRHEPRQGPRQDDDNRPRPRPGPRMSFDP